MRKHNSTTAAAVRVHHAGAISDVSSVVLDDVIKLRVRRTSKSKHHKNKTKHHKDKRKKRRHLKNSSGPEDATAVSVNGSECTGEDDTPEHTPNGNAAIGGDSSNCEATTVTTVVGSELGAKLKLGVKRFGINTKDVEAATIKTEHVDSVRFINDVNNASNDSRCNERTGPGAPGEESDKDTLEDSRTARLQFDDAATFALPRRACQDDSTKSAEYPLNATVDAETAEAQAASDKEKATSAESQNSHEDANCDTPKDGESSPDANDRKLRKKRKKPRHEGAQVDENASERDSLVEAVDEAVFKHRRKKHKHTNEHKAKKHHDVRRAPQDGIVVVEETAQDTPAPEAESLSSVRAVESADGVITEPQRLAIRIKLCQECNSRHLQDACPLATPQYTITDAITYEEWLCKHQENAEVVKAVKSNDPMSEGYGRVADDGFESDDESLQGEQCKNKSKVQREEKLLSVDTDRPLYARDSLPDCLELRITNSDHGLGIYAKNPVPMYAKLGPLIGISIREMDIPDDFSMRHIWEVLSLLCGLLSVIRHSSCQPFTVQFELISSRLAK